MLDHGSGIRHPETAEKNGARGPGRFRTRWPGPPHAASRKWKLIGFLPAVVAQWTLALPVRANPQEADATETDACNERQAGAHFARGLDFVGQGDYRRAIAEFESAYECQPHFAPLYNIAQAYLKLDEHEQALHYLERYLNEGDTRLTAEEVAATSEQMQQLRDALARTERNASSQHPALLDVRCATLGVTLLVDGKPVAESPFPEPVQVPSGRRQIALRAQGRREHRSFYQLEPGELLEVDCLLESEGGERPPTLGSEPVRDKSTLSQTDSNLLAYVVGGVGLAAAGAATGMFLWNRGRFEDWNREDTKLQAARDDVTTTDDAAELERRQQTNNDELESIHSYRDLTVALGVGALAALTVSVYLFLDDAEERSVAWRGNQLVFEGTW